MVESLDGCARLLRPRSLSELESLDPDQAIRHGAQPGELAGVTPQPLSMIEIDDGPIDEHDGRELLEYLGALCGFTQRARFVQQLIDLGFAITRVVERLLAGVETEDVAIRIGAAAPGEHVRLELALVGHVERGREFRRL